MQTLYEPMLSLPEYLEPNTVSRGKRHRFLCFMTIIDFFIQNYYVYRYSYVVVLCQELPI